MDIKSYFVNLPHTVYPNASLGAIVLLVILFIQSNSMPDAPTWKIIAFGAMSIVATLSAFTFRTFLSRLSKVEGKVDDNSTNLEKKVDENKTSLEKKIDENKDSIEEIIQSYKKEINTSIQEHDKAVAKMDQVNRRALASIIISLQTHKKPNFKVEELFEDD